jgi:hypothetical protein
LIRLEKSVFEAYNLWIKRSVPEAPKRFPNHTPLDPQLSRRLHRSQVDDAMGKARVVRRFLGPY